MQCTRACYLSTHAQKTTLTGKHVPDENVTVLVTNEYLNSQLQDLDFNLIKWNYNYVGQYIEGVVPF